MSQRVPSRLSCASKCQWKLNIYLPSPCYSNCIVKELDWLCILMWKSLHCAFILCGGYIVSRQDDESSVELQWIIYISCWYWVTYVLNNIYIVWFLCGTYITRPQHSHWECRLCESALNTVVKLLKQWLNKWMRDFIQTVGCIQVCIFFSTIGL